MTPIIIKYANVIKIILVMNVSRDYVKKMILVMTSVQQMENVCLTLKRNRHIV
jgi:hypothetical protein